MPKKLGKVTQEEACAGKKDQGSCSLKHFWPGLLLENDTDLGTIYMVTNPTDSIATSIKAPTLLMCIVFSPPSDCKFLGVKILSLRKALKTKEALQKMLVFNPPSPLSLPPRFCTKVFNEHLSELTHYFQVLKNNAAFHLYLIYKDQKPELMIS